MQNEIWFRVDPSLFEGRFDQIPDYIVLIILNKVADVRALGRCFAVSKQFNALVPLVHDVYMKIDRVITVDGDSDETMFPQLSHYSPAQVLRNFTHVRNLRIELPAGDVGREEGVVLKWRAEFGSTLQNCVILGGTRIDRQIVSTDQEPALEDNGSIPESFYTNGGLKLRVVWTISSLIAASTRHYHLHPIIEEHPTLRSVVLSDADGQGTLCMEVEQLKEFREKPLLASVSLNRTQVPAFNMKLRYAPYLELPGGMGMQGATLVAIKPSCEGSGGMGGSKMETEAFVCGAFDGPFKSAVKALMKRGTYLLEMDGF